MSNTRHNSRTTEGIYGLSETPQQFLARIAEINRLEIVLKTHPLTADEQERISRQVQWLKAINETDIISDTDREA